MLEEALHKRFPEVSEAVRQRMAKADVDHLKAALDRLWSGAPLTSAEDLLL